ESKHQDPTKWVKECPNELEDLLALYEDGQDVKDIGSNKTWKKRNDTIEMFAKGDYETEDEEVTTESSEEIGE
ncbi:MAG: hypothetical protein IJX12_06945, partial [Lachnospiraceae bacterium]|nr:hypothetical protein [Lachnospiraceae bacterium]